MIFANPTATALRQQAAPYGVSIRSVTDLDANYCLDQLPVIVLKCTVTPGRIQLGDPAAGTPTGITPTYLIDGRWSPAWAYSSGAAHVKRRGLQKSINPARLTPDSRIARADIVRLIAERIRRPSESIRQARNRVSHHLAYAIEKGLLEPKSDGFIVGDLSLWMRRKWPDLFLDIPSSPIRTTLSSTLAVSSSLSARLIPGDLDGCRAALKEAYDQIDQLNLELRTIQAELESLRPLAAKWQAFCAVNKEKAQLPRTPT